MPTYEEREAKAKILAAKTDRYTVDQIGAEKHWDGLTDFMKNAFLHNADEAFIDEQRGEAEAVLAKLVNEDAAKAKASAPVTTDGEQDFAPEVSEANSEARIIEIEPAPTENEESYITEPTDTDAPCMSEPAQEPPGSTPEQRKLLPGQYLCIKCVKPHRAKSSIGKKHMQYKVG